MLTATCAAAFRGIATKRHAATAINTKCFSFFIVLPYPLDLSSSVPISCISHSKPLRFKDSNEGENSVGVVFTDWMDTASSLFMPVGVSTESLYPRTHACPHAGYRGGTLRPRSSMYDTRAPLPHARESIAGAIVPRRIPTISDEARAEIARDLGQMPK